MYLVCALRILHDTEHTSLAARDSQNEKLVRSTMATVMRASAGDLEVPVYVATVSGSVSLQRKQ